MAGGIDGGTADEMFAAIHRESELGFHGVEDAECLGQDGGADAVSGVDGDAVLT